MYYAGNWDVEISINIPFKQIVSNPLNKRIMKTKIFTMILTVMMTLTLSAQGKTRSYFCQQINAPVSTGPTAILNEATYVEWNDDSNTIRMMDGTEWRYQGMRNGCHVYSFWRMTGIILPGIQFQYAVFSADYSLMKVYYVIGAGMPGFAVQMNKYYKYIGDGRQPANDWINGQY